MPPASRRNRSFGTALDLPPGFRAVFLREVGDAFAHAKAHASELGAGTLVFVGRFDLAEFAVVLEPDEPLAIARRALYAGQVALGDALLAYAPPNKAIEFVWPDAVKVDGGLIGGAQFAWADGPEDEPPQWLVFGAMIRLVSLSETANALQPLPAALEEEGFEDGSAQALAESFARHLMVAVDAWQEQGFSAVARNYLTRLASEKGTRRDIADNGDLLVRRMGKTDVERRELVPALKNPTWLDPDTRGPK